MGIRINFAAAKAWSRDFEKARAQLGFRGVRFNFMQHLSHGPNIDTVMALTPRLAAVGMHLQVHFECELVPELSGLLQRSPVPVVIDRMGRADATRGPNHSDFQALPRLLANPRCYVKVSGIDRIDANAPPEARYWRGVVLEGVNALLAGKVPAPLGRGRLAPGQRAKPTTPKPATQAVLI
ncbi:putative TIM-barrel fold metal-dependent hydrolase [Variovorax boronicumulans]|uniref:amidohydrolase family protein n=1 Tax=Variovorax boronicumulans TaxID=436515 RepID=UPI0027835465|nr:amidohydrolase family protein [Variovorax boronicumulans]MDQ0014086.1 putative TIM-barrel fold metal-dependent hydrolase [Variovorax boronicumulans]